MNIRTYHSDDAEACALLFNRVFRRVPAFCPVDGLTLHHGLCHPAPSRSVVSHPQTLVCARADGTIAGFAAFCQRQREGEERPHGLVRLLCYVAKETEVGRALLAESLAALQARGVPFV